MRLFLTAVALLRFVTFGGIYSVLLNLYLLRLGYGPEFIGLVNAVGTLASAAFSLPASALGRRWSSRRMMIAGMSLAAVGYGLLPMTEFTPTAWQAGWILATHVLSWLGFALYIVNSHPFLTAATTTEERSHAFSIRASFTMVGVAGSLIGGLLPGLLAIILGVSLDDPAPYRYPLLMAAALLVPAALVLLCVRGDSVEYIQGPVAETKPAPYGLIALLALVVLLRHAGNGAGRTFFNVYLDASLHMPTAQIGALAAAGNLVAMPAALATPLLTARWGNGRIYFVASLGIALSLLPLALIPHWGAAGLGYMSMVAAASVTFPAFSVYQMEIVSLGWRPTMSGATMMAMGLGTSVMALSGGYVIAALGYRTFFLTAAGLAALGASLFWAYFRVPRGEFARRKTAGQ